jgi:hypothetical protein
MSTITPFPGPLGSKNTSQEDFEREVVARFGLLPIFFRSTPDAPLVIRELWLFAKSAYLDTSIPTLFKERLFVYLSRFCEVRYCITRHCGFLLGHGRSAGDPDAQAMTIAQVVRLLRRPIAGDCPSDGRSIWKILATSTASQRFSPATLACPPLRRFAYGPAIAKGHIVIINPTFFGTWTSTGGFPLA